MGALATVPPAGVLVYDPRIPLELMLEQLDRLASEGFDAYLPVWLSFLEGAGGSVTLIWDDPRKNVWPGLLVGTAEDCVSRERLQARIQLREELVDHLRGHGFRSHLVRHLIGDRAGTHPDADDYHVGRAVSDVVADYLAAGCRIQIEPDGTLSTGGGIPKDYGRVDEARDLEIERATKAYVMATLCPRAVPAIKQIAEAFAHQATNGWIGLRKREVSLEFAFCVWKAALTSLNESELEADDSAAWAVFEFAERLITASAEAGVRAAEIHLWHGLRYEVAGDDCEAAICREDLDFFRKADLDVSFAGPHIVRAISALRATEVRA